ncbi:MAG: 4'-phosphopantetheinyl transferase superfamily protein [Acidobacteriota bacterium]
MSESRGWGTGPGAADLPAGEIHVWLARLTGRDGEPLPMVPVLSPDECQRAGRFVFERDRRQFAASHTFLRRLIGGYLAIDPSDVAFAYSRFGKPAVAGGPEGFSFNLSHSGEAAVVAVSRAGEVGVDIEAIRPLDDRDDLATRFFSSGEVRRLLAMPSSLRSEAFFNCWTRKEAFIKAIGEGLSYALNSFEVTLAPSDPVRLIHVGGDAGEAERWTLAALPAEPGYAGALAVRGVPDAIRYRVWPGARSRRDEIMP